MEAEVANSNIVLYLAIGEFVFLFFIISTILAFFFMGKTKKKDTKATSNLAEKIKSHKQERKSQLSSVLEDIYNLKGDQLAEETKKLIKMENQFYQRFIKTYLTRDTEAVEKIDEDIQKLFQNYNQLVPKPQTDERTNQAIEDIESIESPEHEEQLRRLKDTINNLSDDLKQYKATINRLFYEYTAMFGVDVDPRNQLSAQEIMSRLETGKLGDNELFSDSEEDEEAVTPDSDLIESIINDSPDNPLEVMPEKLPTPKISDSEAPAPETSTSLSEATPNHESQIAPEPETEPETSAAEESTQDNMQKPEVDVDEIEAILAAAEGDTTTEPENVPTTEATPPEDDATEEASEPEPETNQNEEEKKKEENLNTSEASQMDEFEKEFAELLGGDDK